MSGLLSVRSLYNRTVLSLLLSLERQPVSYPVTSASVAMPTPEVPSTSRFEAVADTSDENALSGSFDENSNRCHKTN